METVEIWSQKVKNMTLMRVKIMALKFIIILHKEV